MTKGKKPKVKKSGTSVSDKVRSRRTKKPGNSKMNPFELKVNRQKHSVLGRKIAKSDRGLPGVSRSKAIQKRQETLLVDLKKKRKTNKMVDRRIGENDTNATLEDKMLQRFTRENKKFHEKSSLFRLEDDDNEELTHGGQSLREIEKFDRPISSDEEGDEGMLTGDHVTDGHFGGGILQKKDEGAAEKSWKDRMEEMIAKSKQAKHERQTEKDEAMILTDEVDAEWRLLHNIVANKKRSEPEVHATNNDDYDVTVRQLHFEVRGNPTDRLKTEDELAKEEKEKLDKLEEERIKRMNGVTVVSTKKSRKHQSADSLDDDSVVCCSNYFDFGNQEEEFEVKYKDGKLVTPFQTGSKVIEEDMTERLENMVEDDSDNEEDEVGEEGESSEDEDEDEEDGYSDMESDIAEDSEEEEEHEEAVSDREKQIKSAHDEIPYTFDVPSSYANLVELLDKYPEPADQNTVLTRMKKCNHPSLAAGNKDLLVELFKYLMEYFGDVALRAPVPTVLLDHLTKHLFDLAKLSPKNTAVNARSIILERQSMFSAYCQRKAGRGVWPFMDTLLYFKLLGHLYPTSDFRHDVITPAMIFSSQIYSSCSVGNQRDIAVGLFLSTVMVEYMMLSKALMPEVVCFLSAVLHSAVPDEKSPKVTVGTCTCKSKLLCCKSEGSTVRSMKTLPFDLDQVIVRGVGNSIYNTNQFILSALWTASQLLTKCIQLYKPLVSASALFSHAASTIDRLPLKNYPSNLQESLVSINESIQTFNSRQLYYVCREKKKPKLLRLYEPTFDEIFDGRKKRGGESAASEQQKLRHKHKKEMKGAMREIRKDRQFIANQNIDDERKKDAERKRKTNQIMADLQGQQYERNMFEKMSKKKKR